jgi:hypothetical protein
VPNEDPKPFDEAALEDPAMVDLAAAILDGTPIEWSAVESGVRAGDEAMLRQLRVLAGVGALHRSLPTAHTGTKAAHEDVLPREGLGHWGSLTLLERIGEGAFGEVFRAWDAELRREVALKLLYGGRDSDAPSLLTEGRLLARVRHPNVVTVYGAALHDGRTGLWMEFVRGRTLAARLREEGPLSPAEVARIGVSLCEALSAVHAAGLLHRDVKAQNVMVEDPGRVVLMDFGAGRDQATHDAEMAGTPLYLAPEVFAGGSPSVQSDIYSLGVLLFHLLTTSHPVVADSAADLAVAHKRGTRTSLASLRPDVPARLAAVMARALAPSPADRFATTDAMAVELRAGSGTDVRTRRGRDATAVLGIAVVATVGALVAVFILRRAPPGQSGLTQRRLESQDVRPIGPPSRNGRLLPGVVPGIERLIIFDPRTGARRGASEPLSAAANTAAWGIGSATISADGRHVAYNFGESRSGGASGATQLRIVDVDSTTSRQIYRSDREIKPVGWMQDGRRLLVQSPMGSAAELDWLDVSTRSLTHVAEVAGGALQSFSLSPDGRTVAFDFAAPPAAGKSDLYVLDVSTGHVDPLVQMPSHDQYPVWTGDGSAVVFISDRSGSSGLWKQTVTRGQPVDAPVLIAPTPGIVQLIGLDDSGVLYYVLGPQVAFWTADIDLRRGRVSAPTVVPVSAQGINTYVDWSPDETRIVYTTRRTEPPAGLAIHDFASGAEHFFQSGPWVRRIGRPTADP